ncbi:MAG TPA: M20/M25/M40 family metallo-hydrolase [Bacteroidota bacterium]|nr:M20/M25/M40 family metallo-hydrolase [Bacteroidota bacterium]
MVIDPSEIEQLTRELVRHASVTGTKSAAGGGASPFNETLLAEWIHRRLEGKGVRSVLQSLPDGRKNVFAFVGGASARTVILMGHFDTVPPSPGQALSAPSGGDDGFLYGRGSLDMKSGIAVAMTLMERWQNGPAKPDVSVLFVATCDEEVESSGVLRAIGLISRLKGNPSADTTGGAASDTADGAAAAFLTAGTLCEFLGVINVDYTTERYPGDPDYHVWEGTVGKILAGVYVRGYQTHAGEYFRGFHAMGLLSRLVTGIDGCSDISGKAPPPATLRVKDAKDEYNVMTSPAGWAYFNIFTTENTPAKIMEILRAKSDRVIGEYLADLNKSFRAYGEAAGVPAGGLLWDVGTRTWSEIHQMAVKKAGPSGVKAALDAVNSSGRHADVREAGFEAIAALLDLLGDRDPVVVLAFLPPFYPYISPDLGAFGSVVRKIIRKIVRERPSGDGRAITTEEFYPYISDMSYLRIEPEIRKNLGGLTDEMPSWGDRYSLDFTLIGRVDLPVVNVGPYGFGAHQPEERVEKKYSFEILPALLRDIVAALR